MFGYTSIIIGYNCESFIVVASLVSGLAEGSNLSPLRVKWCIKICECSILTIKENCQTEIWKEYYSIILIELRLFFIDILAFSRQIMPRGGDFVSFFRPRGRSFALKTVPGVGILTGKISGPGVSPGGMVAGQIDTCIIEDNICFIRIGNLLKTSGSNFHVMQLEYPAFSEGKSICPVTCLEQHINKLD